MLEQDSISKREDCLAEMSKCRKQARCQLHGRLYVNKAFHGRFEKLKEFCGGLATVFPGTATVESDFSLINYEKNDFRTALTDLSLEGILHSKQYATITSFKL